MNEWMERKKMEIKMMGGCMEKGKEGRKEKNRLMTKGRKKE